MARSSIAAGLYAGRRDAARAPDSAPVVTPRRVGDATGRSFPAGRSVLRSVTTTTSDAEHAEQSRTEEDEGGGFGSRGDCRAESEAVPELVGCGGEGELGDRAGEVERAITFETGHRVSR